MPASSSRRTSFAPTRQMTASSRSHPASSSLSEARRSTRRHPLSYLTRPWMSPHYLLRGSYERNITPRFFWNTGASWDRNDDAGILNRYIVHAGVGNTWVDIERRRFATSYGISYTDREEEKPDPEKDRRFAGARLGWDYMEQFNAGTTFDNKFARTSISPIHPTTRSTPPAR